MRSIPVDRLAQAGWETEILVVDNGSVDHTGQIAAQLGATVIVQPERGYGNAYRAGFNAAKGEVIASGDADQTYPFDHLPELLATLDADDVEFLTTNRLHAANKDAMKGSHFVANHVLSIVGRLLFRHSIKDSQSGMWVFRRHVWEGVDVRSTGMAFSQEIKNASVRAGFRVTEIPIEYRVRGGQVKLNSISDGIRNLTHLVEHRMRRPAAGKARQSPPGGERGAATEGEGSAAEHRPSSVTAA
jgi:glycosyltransferase involved in cell wall biosynthesis